MITRLLKSVLPEKLPLDVKSSDASAAYHFIGRAKLVGFRTPLLSICGGRWIT